ncbi:hypothetical protein [Bacillus wiedmannii]|nr:hypothetical protein [Bacillus wiedmannii]
MKKEGDFFVGLFWGSLFSVILWISFFGWLKILTLHFHNYKDWLISFW